MAGDSVKKFGIKNLIFLVVTAVLLIVATVCWFMEAKNNKVETLDNDIETGLAQTTFFEAVDSNHNNVIDGDEQYVEKSSTEFSTKNMVPGQKYFFRIEITSSATKNGMGLYFNGITDSNGTEKNKFGDSIKINAKITDNTGSSIKTYPSEKKLSSLYVPDGEIINAPVIEYSGGLNNGTYKIDYTVQIDDVNFKIDKAGYSLTVNDVSAIVTKK